MFDYTTVTADSISDDIEEVLGHADAVIDAVVAVGEQRTFSNTLQPLADLGSAIGDAYGRGPFLGNSSPDEEIRNVARAAEERTAKWHVELLTREDVYAAMVEFAQTEEAQQLAGEQRRFLDFTLRDFEMAGHGLAREARSRLAEINARLVEIGIAFARNLAEYEDYLVVTKRDLAGLPDWYREGLKEGEKQGTYLVSMDYPDVIPFMENAVNRELREALSAKFNSRAVATNRVLLEEAVALRREVADLFSMDSWAHYRMQEKMAKTPDRVDDFYRSLIPPLHEKALAEMDAMRDRLEADTGSRDLQSWDRAFYHTQMKKRDFGLDPEEVAAYFQLERVVEGMFELTAEVFDLRYRQVQGAPSWHPDARLYEVTDRATGEHIGSFYMDLFPREGKFGHAAAWPLVHARGHGGPDEVRPVSAILANFTKSTSRRPSLLTHNEVVTLFHEFGHVLHMSLARTRFSRFSGASTEWDFVEAPSQIMEHWCYKPSILQRFATHHETGEVIPTAIVTQLEAARQLNIAMSTVRQISFGVFDMGIHGPQRLSLDEALEAATRVSLFPRQSGTFFPASFGHMFGYDAGYYGYLWSEVFGDDMFSEFERHGLTDTDVGVRYRQSILEPNGSRDADDLLVSFLGREPSNQAFLDKLGIATASEGAQA